MNYNAVVSAILLFFLIPVPCASHADDTCRVARASALPEEETHEQSCIVCKESKSNFTYASVPLIASAFIVKEHQRYTSPMPRGKNHFAGKLDDYTRFAPYPTMIGMKLMGYDGHSDWSRLASSVALSNAIMFSLAGGTKWMTDQTRPDGADDNSFPSGHSAVAFTAATIFHKEYGMTRSPWFSIGGYSLATATAAMRVVKNKHWTSDVIGGAGIGILSAELGYCLTDLLFKKKGIVRPYSSFCEGDTHSFVDVEMGVGINEGDVTFDHLSSAQIGRLALATSSVFGIEGASFVNNTLGLGGNVRLTATTTEPFFADGTSLHTMSGVVAVDNCLATLSADAGIYARFPVTDNFTIGAKALAGVRMGDGIRYELPSNSQTAAQTLRISTDAAFNYVLGVSCSWRYKGQFAWKLFLDYDASKCNVDASASSGNFIQPFDAKQKVNNNFFTIGGAFSVCF